MNTVTFKGKTMHLEGELPVVGEPAPTFTLTANDLSERRLRDFLGKPLVLVAVPSLDTPVCDLEGRRFNAEASKLADKVKIVVVSCDLPFAQARWLDGQDNKNIEALSDYRHHDFGRHYGILIKELDLLARSVFVIDKSGVLTYSQLVPEVSQQPDFDAVMRAIQAVL